MPEGKKSKKKAASPALEFNHAMVYVRDVTQSLRFYSDLLGFKVIETFQGRNAPVYARLRPGPGRTTIALHMLEPGKTVAESQGVRLYFETKNLDRICKNLEAGGVQLTQAPKMMPWGWKHAYVNDPDGHEVSLYWAGAKRFQKTKM
jgi:catechol 2,3-dioxygenase-like lactoylglutathione lyase family enzyme